MRTHSQGQGEAGTRQPRANRWPATIGGHVALTQWERRDSAEQLHGGHVLVAVLAQHLAHCHLKVLLRDVDAALAQRKHASLGANALALGTRRVLHHARDLAEVNAAHEVHLAAVDLENVLAALLVRSREFHLAVDPAWAKQRWVQDVDAVRGHDHLDVLGGLEAVQLVEELEHRALHLAVASARVGALPADGIHLIHEDDGWGLFARHDEELAHHAGPLADVLLHELRAAHANEGAIGMVRNGAGKKRLSGARRAVHEDSLGLGDAEGFEELRVLDRELDHLLHLLDLLAQAADHVVRGVRDLLHPHQTDERVHLAGEDAVQGVAVGAERHARVGNAVADLERLLHLDDVLAVRPDLDQNPVLAHLLHDLANVARRLLQLEQLLSKQPNLGVDLVALGLQAAQVELLLPNLQLERVQARLVVRREPLVPRFHLGSSRG
mmetsp:Transcript_15463/g.58588  ORF Transcript_15463/g.58588 Transcript_15463/m.58588 type:complete len:439 (+) Transcript_15463:3359-4675(+)